MPKLEGRGYGQAEREWGNEMVGEKNYEVRWQEAEDKLHQFLEELNANTSMIAPEDYNEYLEPAKFYQEVAEKHRGDIDNKLLQAANSIVHEAPEEAILDLAS